METTEKKTPVQINKNLHQKLKEKAVTAKKTMTEIVEKAIQKEISKKEYQ